MAERALTIKILGDAKGFASATADAEKSAGKMGDSLTKSSEGVKEGFGKAKMAAVGLGVGLLALAGPIVSQGTNLDALGKKSATVFEGSLGDVQAWSKGNAAALGMTTSELTGAAAAMADLLKPMGFTAAEAAKMSTGMLDLSGALSAWSGGTKSAAEVSDILSAAMLGETDGLKALGIAISADDVAKRLAVNGTDQLTGAALKQATAIATQQLIMEQSTDAQKAWANGSMDAIKRQNESGAAVSQLKETLVTGLFPAFSAALPLVTNLANGIASFTTYLMEHKGVAIALGVVVLAALVPAFVAWATAAGAAALATIAATWPVIAIGAAIAGLAAGVIYAYKHWDAFRNVVDSVASFVKGTLWPALQQVGGWISGTLVPIVVGIATKVGEFGKAVFDLQVSIAKDIIAVVGFFVDLPGKIANALGSVASAITAPFRSAFGSLKSLWNSTVGGFGFSIPDWIPGVGGKGFNIPMMADGGIVTRPTLAIIGEAGPEAVVPLSRLSSTGGGGGQTIINVTVSALDPKQAGRAVYDAIDQWTRLNGRLPARMVG